MGQIFVKKRDNSLEIFNADKINKVVDWAVKDINNVNASDIIMQAHILITDRIKTTDLHDALISAAEDLTTLENPNYDKVAANLRNYKLRKRVWGGKNPPKLLDFMKKMID